MREKKVGIRVWERGKEMSVHSRPKQCLQYNTIYKYCYNIITIQCMILRNLL